MPQLSTKIAEALNDQINKELSSAYTYLAMSAYCDEQNFQGAAHWLRMQWEEELAHATKLIDYIAERGGKVTFSAIPQPKSEYGSLHELFAEVLQHEKDVTAAIYRIYDVSVAEKDYAAQTLMQWYVNEQVEEENSADEILSMLKLAGESGSGLLMVDRQLAARARE